MKHTFVLVAALLAATAHAQEPTTCALISQAATATMKARQAGGDMAAMMASVEKLKTEWFKKVMYRIVIDAYEVPRYRSESVQIDATWDFRDKWHLQCVKLNNQPGD